ncbi:Protein Ycf2, partial [Bienertia sinuspersici]
MESIPNIYAMVPYFGREILCLPQKNLISEISSKCLHNLLQSEEMIHRNNESPLIWTHLGSPN